MKRHYVNDIDEIREREYPALKDVTYLDHAGTTLYAKSMIEQFSKDLTSNLFGNPHSASPSSKLSTQRVEDVRARVLRFFKADPDDFDVVFVANATGAIKLVADAFRDYGLDTKSERQCGFWYGYHKDAHTSLVGVRELATAGSKCFESDEAVEDWLAELDVSASRNEYGHGLFAYPAQSNLDGHRLPLDWPDRLRKSQNPRRRNIYTLLDASSYASTGQLDFSDVESSPDFTALSFYKIFGFPDLGALIIRKQAGHMLQRRRYFGGGTVDMVISMKVAWHVKKQHTLHDQLEDGTLPFHNIIALEAAFNVHKELYGSMASISQHTCQLAEILHSKLSSLRHGNGRQVCQIYGNADSKYGDSRTQAPIVAFDVRNSQGGWVGKSKVEQSAIEHNIHLRTVSACNPGGIAAPWEMRRNFSEGMRCGSDLDVISGKTTGVIRVSLGPMSSLSDVEIFIDFMEKNWVEKGQPLTMALPLEWPESMSEQQSFVKGLKVFPIEGCAGWEVPITSTWEIRQHGLAWNHEWCLVRPRGMYALDSKVHPSLAFLQPSLDIQEGVLKINVESIVFDDTQVPRELTVSLWESPPTNAREPQRGPQRAADPYLSAEIEEFFTSVVGTPCTLARYPDPRSEDLNERLQQQTSRFSRSKRILEGPCSLSVANEPNGVGDARVAINLSSVPLPLTGQHNWRFMKIGRQYFQAIEPSSSFKKASRDTSVISRQFRHLTCPGDVSLAVQHPTICVGDAVQLLYESSVAEGSTAGRDNNLSEPIGQAELLPGRDAARSLVFKISSHPAEFNRSVRLNSRLWSALRV
ncbi:hypothetical protein MMC08_005205 [Hypocenomyce scalaris]|nr:hypothetical protein [Hypocenomyce scalaris]